jgi:hypothetical protein
MREDSLINKTACRDKHHKKNLSEILMNHPPSLIENEEYEEFYKYKEATLNVSKDSESRKLAGSKIEPFKKYQIRDIYLGGTSQRSHLAQVIHKQ